jgi:hypothetical protein
LKVNVLGRGVLRSASQELHLPSLAKKERHEDLVAGTVVAAHAEVDIDESFLEKLAEEVRKDLG